MKTNDDNQQKNPLGKTKGIFCLKKPLFFLLLVSALFSFAQAKMEIKDAKKNFGFVKRGVLVKLEYDLTNTGTEPLIINDAEVSCSCTSVEFPKQPIAPNQTAKIIVSFDTKTVYDRQDRTVLLKSNDPKSPLKIRYKGIVSRK